MNGSGNPFDPNRPDGSWYNPFPDGGTGPAAAASGFDLSPISKVGLFGGGYANWLKNQPPPDLVALGAPADFSTDGTGLPPSVTMTGNLPMHSDPTASLQQVLGFKENDLGLPSPAGAQQSVPLSSWEAPAAASVSSMPDLWQIDGKTPTTAAGDAGAPVVQYDLPGIGTTYFDPEFAGRLDDFRQRAQADGVPLTFVSGYRTPDLQNRLRNDPTATAPAKFSLHSTGDAVDIPVDIWKNLGAAGQSKLVENARQAGLGWGGTFKGQGYDPRHFYYDPGGNRPQRIEDFGQAIQALKDRQPQ